MIWIIINIILLIVGIVLIIASGIFEMKNLDDISAALCGLFGLFLLAVLVVSEPLRWWLG